MLFKEVIEYAMSHGKGSLHTHGTTALPCFDLANVGEAYSACGSNVKSALAAFASTLKDSSL